MLTNEKLVDAKPRPLTLAEQEMEDRREKFRQENPAPTADQAREERHPKGKLTPTGVN
jgi:hypothetical protein